MDLERTAGKRFPRDKNACYRTIIVPGWLVARARETLKVFRPVIWVKYGRINYLYSQLPIVPGTI